MMSRALRAGPVVLLAFVLTSCIAGVAATTTSPTSTGPTHLSSGAVAEEDAGFDLGNGRPHVTYDGLMVRRRVAIAIHPTPGANLVSLRKELDNAATRAHTSLASIPPAVLDPALLEPVAPEMTLALPPGNSLDDAKGLVDRASSDGRRLPDIARYDVAPVLVHDLRFTVSSAQPAVLAAAIAREGILTDALDTYTTTPGRQGLDITYTGPLLSDELVESVRGAIARRANISPSAVSVSPRTTTGAGVDMAKEPAPAPAVTQAASAHRHGAALPAASAALLAASGSSDWTLWAVSVAALAALLILTLVMLTRRRRVRRPD